MRYLSVCLLLLSLTTSQALLPPLAFGQIALKANDSSQKVTFVIKIFELPIDASPTSDDANAWLQLSRTLVSQNKASLRNDTTLSIVSGERGSADNSIDLNLLIGKAVTTFRATNLVEVDANVRPDGKIFTRFIMEASVPGSASAGLPPNISRQKIKTTLLLENGQTTYLRNLYVFPGSSGAKQWVLFITPLL